MHLITPDLLDRIEQELLDAYDGTDYVRPPAIGPVIIALQQTVIDLHDRARDLADCTKIDTCTAEAIFLRHLADWLSDLAEQVGRRDVPMEDALSVNPTNSPDT